MHLTNILPFINVQEQGQKVALYCSDKNCIKSLIDNAAGSQRATVLHFMTVAVLVMTFFVH